MRLTTHLVLLGLPLLALVVAPARAATLSLDFSSPAYLGWSVESIDSPASEALLISFLGTLTPGASAPIADHQQTEMAYRSTNLFASPLPAPLYLDREEDAHELYDTFSLSGVSFVVAKFGAGLQDDRTITGYTGGRNPRPKYAPSTHVWYLEVAGADFVQAAVPSNLQGLSHVTTYGGGGAGFSGSAHASVPDGGTTLLLVAGALGGLVFFGRRFI